MSSSSTVEHRVDLRDRAVDGDGAEKLLGSRIEEWKQSPEWHDWRWQLRNSVRSIDEVERLLGIRFEAKKRAKLELTLRRFPLAITPHYLSLVARDQALVNTGESGYTLAKLWYDPVFRQAFPSTAELEVRADEHSDPLAEESDSPVPLLTHRYPDRVLFHVSHQCAMYCRHCTRKRKVGDPRRAPAKDEYAAAFEYIRRNPEVRDVLVSGGDPLMLSDARLESILKELRSIPHVEVIRIGTRVPVVLPQRVTPELVAMLRRYHPLWINTHFNHSQEICPDSERAVAMLADAGIPLGNQSVLLAGVNDCVRVMRRLVQDLVRMRIRPYYLYQCDLSEGLAHFRTRVGKGIEIIESLLGHTSGFAVPTYVIDAPDGGGKIACMPNYLVSWSTNKVVLRNYEGVMCTYPEPEGYQEPRCAKACDDCHLQMPEHSVEVDSIGVARLLDDADELRVLVPQGCERVARREDEEAS
ncbi:MAG: lysine 2,3-aminomutase [Myxococcota bacterium]|nr:lysine 2,3-aminomutase [Myxococcota bacterium]